MTRSHSKGRFLFPGLAAFVLLAGCSGNTAGPDPGNGPDPDEPIWMRDISVHALAEPIKVDSDRVYVSSAFGVGALIQETGEAVWEAEPSTGIAGNRFILAEHVIVVARDNALVGLEATNGALLWMSQHTAVETLTTSESGGVFATDGESLVSYDPLTGSTLWAAAVADGGIIELEAGLGLVCVERLISPPADARITCYDESDGATRWTRLIHSPPWIAITPTHVVVAGLELGEGPGFMGLDRSTGNAAWKRPGISGNAPAISNEEDVFYTCSNGCLAVRGNTGATLWETDIDKPVGGPILAEGLISVTAFLSDPSPLYILDAATGSVRASILPALSGGFCGLPAINDSFLFVFSCGGTLYAFDISSLIM